MGLDDLQNGMTYFKKRVMALSCAAKVGKVNDTNTFMPLMDPITTEEQFNEKFDNALYDFEVQHYETELQDPYLEYHSASNYQTYEALKGWTEDSSGNKNFRPNMRVHFQKQGLFGQCSDMNFISMLNSVPDTQCSFKAVSMTEDFCTKALSIADLLKTKISVDGTEENSIPISKGIIKKYNYFGDFDQDATPTADLE